MSTIATSAFFVSRLATSENDGILNGSSHMCLFKNLRLIIGLEGVEVESLFTQKILDKRHLSPRKGSTTPRFRISLICSSTEDKSSLEVSEYRNSKEHQSIKKALIVNCLFLGFCVVLSSFFSFIISKKSSKGSTVLVLKSLFSLYRAFAPIVSSIYCFDVIRCLFQQIFETAVDDLRKEYERARGLL